MTGTPINRQYRRLAVSLASLAMALVLLIAADTAEALGDFCQFCSFECSELTNEENNSDCNYMCPKSGWHGHCSAADDACEDEGHEGLGWQEMECFRYIAPE